MDAQPSRDYRYIEITGRITVARTDVIGRPRSAQKLVLILGPTGAGKSTFIEALSDNSMPLGISSNRLDGFTQSVSAYQIHYASHEGDQIYVVDVPGFADTKISAMSIVLMLKDWMRKNNVQYFDELLYLTPINVVRIPGSQREVLRLFRALTGINTARMITIVSTMWDAIWSDSARERAERNFTQLQEDIWKDEYERGSPIVRFTNTQDSALSILDASFNGTIEGYLNVESLIRESKYIQHTPFGSHLYEDLETRISCLQLQRYNIQMEIQETSASSDKELIAMLHLHLEEVENLLAKFEQELREFGPSLMLPIPSQFELNVHQTILVPFQWKWQAPPQSSVMYTAPSITQLQPNVEYFLESCTG